MVFCLSLLFILAFYLKHDSSQGRLLVYNIACRIWTEHPFGIGFGQFKSAYLDYQADCFRKGIYTQKELLLAGNTWYLFNDYFQIIVENGVKGIILIIGYMLMIIHFLTAYRKQGKSSLLFGLALTVILTISVAALFNHFYERQWCKLALLFSLVVLLLYSYRCLSAWQYPVLFIAVVVIAGVTTELVNDLILKKISLRQFSRKQRTGWRRFSFRKFKPVERSL